jgi:hypothetical protein
MMKIRLWASLLALSCGLACTSHTQQSAAQEQAQSSSQPNTNVSRRSAATPEVKLVASGDEAPKYPSDSTQTISFTVGNMDESKGITVTSGGNCVLKSSAEKTGPGAYKVSLNIPSKPEDGNCYIGVASTANGAYTAVDVNYTADPDYWKKAAPDMFAFVNSKTWTIKASAGKTQTFQVTHTGTRDNGMAALATGPDDTNAALGFTLPDKVAGSFGGCVLQGTFSKGTATLNPIVQTDECKQVGTLTVKASD